MILANVLRANRIPRSWLLILLLALIVRGLVFSAILSDPARLFYYLDSEQYLDAAQGLVETGRFGTFGEDGAFQAEVWRTPGYPVFLAVLIGVSQNPMPLALAAAVQALIGVAVTLGTMVLAYKLSAQMGLDSKRIAILAGGLYALAPISAVMTAYLYAEIVFSAWMLAAALLIVLALEHRRIGLAALAGVCYGAAILTRPIGLLLIPLLVLLPFSDTQPPSGEVKSQTILRSGSYAAALLVGLMLLTGAWLYRNYHYYGRFALASVSDSNLLYYNAASLEAHRQGIGIDEARDQLYGRLGNMLIPASRWPFGNDGLVARQVIMEHPISFGWYNGIDALNSLRPGFGFMLSVVGEDLSLSPPDLWGQGRWPLLVLEGLMLLHLLIMVAGFLIGWVVLVVRRRWLALLLLGVIPALLLYLPGLASNARFRAPVEPFLVIAAAIGWMTLVKWWELRRVADSEPPSTLQPPA